MHAESDTQETTSPGSAILRILQILTAFALGGFVSMVVVNRLLVAQLAVYGDTYMASASAIIDFMDDILPYLAATWVGFVGLALATLAVWVWAKVPVRTRRYGIAFLALVSLIAVVWLLAGQSTPISPEPLMMTPTPVP